MTLQTMSNDDWYRHKTWDSKIEADFEARLKRSRRAFNKAQYLRIQASYLLDSTDEKNQVVGLNLIERLIKDFPSEDFSVIFGQEQLGDFYLKRKDYEKAEQFFRVVTKHYQDKKSRSGTSAMADLKLAETILRSNRRDKFEEAYQLVTSYPIPELTFNDSKFYYSELRARLCDALNKKTEAKEFAKAAIEISKVTEPQFSRHKTVGLVKASERQLRTLEQILVK
jgi:tetratricopeptide (TPR) repeat protein